MTHDSGPLPNAFACWHRTAKLEPVTVSDDLQVAIPARTERQAMDWSLVLASQGIGVTLDRETQGEWLLVVEESDEARAWAAIRQYQRENRGFDWHREIPGSNLLFDGRVLFWALATALVFWVQDAFAAGLFDTRAVRQGEWWRAVTAVWLHKDIGHLASNLALGVVFLGLSMARFGAGVALLGSLAAGALANLTAMALRSEPYIGLGASGLVMGALGMIAAQSLRLWNTGRRGTRLILTGMGTGVLVFILTGTRVESDVLAHLGGFVFGLLFGGLASLIPARCQSGGNMAADWSYLILALGTLAMVFRGRS
ncbi:MAG: rhomboid family intramembrane serine protease [Verrucomicrobiae bacterium]|nr:rhomboid family intramembrane serine protease [Verrucomicrobiae bacterium]